MKTLIIIPTYNEEDNIYSLIKDVFEVVKDFSADILVVDDNSSDETQKYVEQLQTEYKNLFLLKRKAKLGLASAYIDGFMYGLKNDYDSFIQMDADFSHNPKYLPEILNKLSDFDVVIGSRNIENGSVVNWSVFRKIISKCGSVYSSLILNCPIKDMTGGFNGWTKNAIQKINLKSIISNGYSFQIEMKYKAYKAKVKIKEIPIIFENRKYGKSKMNNKIFLEALVNVIKLRLD